MCRDRGRDILQTKHVRRTLDQYQHSSVLAAERCLGPGGRNVEKRKKAFEEIELLVIIERVLREEKLLGQALLGKSQMAV
jgi:hypothetical protein